MNEHRAHGRTRHAAERSGHVEDTSGEATGRHRTAEERVRAAQRQRPAPEPLEHGGVVPPASEAALPAAAPPASARLDSASSPERSPGPVDDGCAGGPHASGAATGPGEAADQGPSLAVERRAAQGEGLELVERLAEGGGTRTWLAREQSTREGFTVTFAVSEDPGRRRPVEAGFAAVVEAWAQESHPALVGVRAVLAVGPDRGDDAPRGARDGARDGATSWGGELRGDGDVLGDGGRPGEGAAPVGGGTRVAGATRGDGTRHEDGVNGGGSTRPEDGRDLGALVAEHAKAHPLAEIMREKGRVAPETLLPVLADCARGLARLHERGWVHGALSAQHILVTPEGGATLDGYGVRAGSAVGPPAWGQAPDRAAPRDRPGHWEVPGHPVGRNRAETVRSEGIRGEDLGDHEHTGKDGRVDGAAVVGADPATVASPAQDVHDLAVTGWLALTGRYPGPDSHRVPLSLMCPTAPRHLVLMLEAALNDDPAQRPSAHELAAGFDTPVRRSAPARRPPERMTPEVIRADGTVLRPRRRPFAGAALRLGGRGERDRGREGDRARAPGRATVRTAAMDAGEGGRRRVLAITAAVLAAAVIAWGFVSWTDGDDVAGTGAAASTAAPEDTVNPSGAHTAGAGGTPSGTGGAAGEADGSASRDAGPTGGQTGDRVAPTTAGSSSAGASAPPGESMQDKDREAREAVGDLVARRATALAAGDEAAAEEVYVPRSGLAARDKDLIRRAAAQADAGTGHTALTGVSMEVVSLTEQRADPGSHLTPAEAARTRTYDAEVVTRGWNGALPTGSAVTRDGEKARQHLRITITSTADGWRLADVTPVADAG